MPKWTVTASVVGSKCIGEYEADTKEEAEAMAWKDADVFLCHQCAEECSDPEIAEMFVEPSPVTP